MRKDARVLFAYEPGNTSCKLHVDNLKEGLTGWDITISEATWTTRLFDLRNYNLVHLFHSPVPRAVRFLRSATKAYTVQTILGPPERPEDYRHIVGADRVIVFTEADREAIRRTVSEAEVQAIVPCVKLPDMNLLEPPAQ